MQFTVYPWLFFNTRNSHFVCEGLHSRIVHAVSLHVLHDYFRSMVAAGTICLVAVSVFERYSVATGTGSPSVHRRMYCSIRRRYGEWIRRWWLTCEERIWKASALGHLNRVDGHGRPIDGTRMLWDAWRDLRSTSPPMLQNRGHYRCWIHRVSVSRYSVSVRFRFL